jgi:hypothetical protein
MMAEVQKSESRGKRTGVFEAVRGRAEGLARWFARSYFLAPPTLSVVNFRSRGPVEASRRGMRKRKSAGSKGYYDRRYGSYYHSGGESI